MHNSQPALLRRLPASGAVTALRRTASWIVARFSEWQERAEQRAHLASMDDAMLKDIGVSAGEAWREASKPFWRP